MPLGLAPLTVGRPPASTVVAAAASAGFDAVGLTLWPPEGELSPLCGDARARRALRSELAGSGVSVLDLGVVVLSPALDLGLVRRFVDAGAALGGDRLIVMNREPAAARAAEQLAAVCEVARPAGVRVAVEFMPYTATRTLRDAEHLLRTAGAAGAGLVVDVLHLYRSGGSAADVAAVDAGLIHLVQLCDARLAAPPADRLRAEALGDRLYPGEGELPLLDLLSAVPEAVPLTVEAPVARDAGRSPEERAAAAAAATGRLLAGAAVRRAR